MCIEKLQTIMWRVQSEKLVENIGIQNTDGPGLDFRLGRIYQHIPEAQILFDDEGIHKAEAKRALVMDYGSAEFFEECLERGEVSRFNLKPGIYYPVETIEKVNVPIDLWPQAFPLENLVNNGFELIIPMVKSGHKGALRFGLINRNEQDIPIALGTKICHVVFHKRGV